MMNWVAKKIYTSSNIELNLSRNIRYIRQPGSLVIPVSVGCDLAESSSFEDVAMVDPRRVRVDRARVSVVLVFLL